MAARSRLKKLMIIHTFVQRRRVKKNRRVRETQKIKKNNTNKEFSTHFLSSLRFKCLHSHNSVVEKLREFHYKFIVCWYFYKCMHTKSLFYAARSYTNYEKWERMPWERSFLVQIINCLRDARESNHIHQ